MQPERKKGAVVVTPPGSLPTLPTNVARPRVHMIGLGGTGMSALARILLGRKAKISGSDRCKNGRIRELIRAGVAFCEGQDGGSLPEDCELVVRSAAVPDDNPEIVEAKKRGVRVIKYSTALGDLMAGARGIAVAGTHGKTTTTAMASHVFLSCGVDPTFVVGGEVRQLGGSARVGQGPHFIAEACEFDRSFLKLRPCIALITNVEADHLDYYRDLAEIQDAFRSFIRLLPADGLAVINGDDKSCGPLRRAVGCRLETFGLEQGNNWQAVDVCLAPEGASARLLHDGQPVGQLQLALPGVHNLLNALAVVASAAAEGLALPAVLAALSRFKGVDRRFQILADRNGLAVVDDYAHHPTEVAAVLRAARERYPTRRLIAVFQPHQHSRTRLLFEDFARALALADEVVLPDIYAARDSVQWCESVSSQDLVARIRELGVRSRYVPDFADVVESLTPVRQAAAVFMGAGDLTTAAHALGLRLSSGRSSGLTRNLRAVRPKEQA